MEGVLKTRVRTLEQITVRRAKIVDTDKVRYRVYSTPVEFIAVIAESALMAVKVSGIARPHKIVRDLPTDRVALEARKMAALEDAPERVALPMTPVESSKHIIAELQPQHHKASQAAFRPITLADLKKTSSAARILPPEMLSEIIEQHSRIPVPQPLMQAAPPDLPDDHPLQMVRQALSEESPPDDDGSLSPDDVEKLLNE